MAAEEPREDAGVVLWGHRSLDPQTSVEAIADGLDERRDAPRFPLNEDCEVLFGMHVQRVPVGDVSSSGAMLHGVRHVIVGDILRLCLDRLPDQPIPARVRGISLLGVHVSIEDGPGKDLWQSALRGVLGSDQPTTAHSG
ncbi:PilZ domain-containing protein [Roseomonas sp. JC162]|uniref:PilZ domain-containing protein n=1 Tax=Neoroseomonas marina TaxID=1232220 RepID=A0A848EJE5_9PROT|nr:PilZ domain-containing protein [Neoroseomonas marina]NMJ43513.1 PilZ domain-containing protein [Neoroseomonas marina]